MSKRNYIIPRRIERTERPLMLSGEEQAKHLLAKFLTSNFLCNTFATLLDEPTSHVIKALVPYARKFPAIKDVLIEHEKHFPDRYVLPDRIAMFLLIQTYEAALKGVAQARREGTFFDPIPPQRIIMRLIAAGANLFPILSPQEVSAEQIDNYLGHSPPGTVHAFHGFTLLHAHCFDSDFVSRKLPMLARYQTDINSISTDLPVGTFVHIMLANELFKGARDAIRLPLMRKQFDPSSIDGEKKTIPIIAAKVRAETFLLELANLYPGKLALDAQDENGRTVMHYCFGLGLIKAAQRYTDLGASLDIEDQNGRTPIDYLNLSPEETSEILRSIEIYPGRDVSARRNAILGQAEGSIAVRISGKPQLATRNNYTRELSEAAYAQFGEAGMRYIAEQHRRLRGLSVLEDILEKRAELRSQYERGLLVPGAAVSTRGAKSIAPSSPK